MTDVPERNPETVARILEERARTLARPEAAPSRAETTELLVVTIDGERYAIEIESVVEVSPLRGLVPLPGTPDFVAGVILNNGRLLPLFDLHALLGLAGGGVKPERRVVAVQGGGIDFGLVVDAVLGVVRVNVDDLTAGAAGGDLQASFVRAVSPVAAVLDIEALAVDGRIRIDQEPL